MPYEPFWLSSVLKPMDEKRKKKNCKFSVIQKPISIDFNFEFQFATQMRFPNISKAEFASAIISLPSLGSQKSFKISFKGTNEYNTSFLHVKALPMNSLRAIKLVSPRNLRCNEMEVNCREIWSFGCGRNLSQGSLSLSYYKMLSPHWMCTIEWIHPW